MGSKNNENRNLLSLMNHSYLKLGMGEACAGQTKAKDNPDFLRIFWPSFSLINLGGVLPIGSIFYLKIFNQEDVDVDLT